MSRENKSNVDKAGGSARNASFTREDILASLRLINAPEISEEDFARLYKGRMVEVFDLIAGNIVGRNGVAAARTSIQQWRESLNSRKPYADQDVDPLFTSARRAESHLKNARVSLTGVQATGEEQTQALANLEREEMELQRTLEDKQLTAVLLSVLERKNKIHDQRFAEIARLLEELRYETSRYTEKGGLNTQPLPHLMAQTKPRATEHTRDALSALQAHALRASRLSRTAPDSSSPSRVNNAEQCLLQAVARSMNSTVDDEIVLSAFQTLRSAGQAQARLSVQYQSPLPMEPEKGEDVLEVSHRVREKEQELQGFIDQSAALTLACAQSLQTITSFGNETSPALRKQLREESDSAQGHVDVLRLSIINRTEAPAGPTGADSLSRGLSFEEALEAIRRHATEARDTEQFLLEAENLIAPEPGTRGRNESLINQYVKEQTELSEKIKKLLERKGKKTEAGGLLVQEIERLVAEVGIISGSHV